MDCALSLYWYDYITTIVVIVIIRGVASEGDHGEHAPSIVDRVHFYGEKLAKVILFSLPEVFCGPQICQKCVGGRLWGAGHPLLPQFPRDSRAFGAQLLWPQCKILATPLVVVIIIIIIIIIVLHFFSYFVRFLALDSTSHSLAHDANRTSCLHV